ncbi:hypothetical protein HYH03_017367 [Edaphochlamys debaryana]|uniref:SAP domain-containing protein n=1 Tax=Edaphochlamys debaryana TaxID=47281 RepID=A0A835XMN5_9CHLO|nr:hypothetical protein HYH03_017367 [Edaphochlamys debaryana]|eukprot:KAG2483770.1 hypothetical protein HYH03_017367 [Edaphochlamys debaryana]
MDGDGHDEDWQEEEEEDDFKANPESRKEKLIFLVDAQQQMFEEIKLDGPTTSFEAALRCVRELIKLKAIQNPEDEVAVILYNTQKKDGEGEPPGGGAGDGGGGEEEDGGGRGGTSLVAFEGVRTLVDLRRPCAEVVKTVRDLSLDDFRSSIGSLPQRRDSALADALWRAQHCLAGSKSADRSYNTVVVFTNDEEPCGTGPEAQPARSGLHSRAEALAGYRVRLRLFPLAAAVGRFRVEALWRPLLRRLPGPDPEAEEGEEGGGGGAAGGGGSQAEEGGGVEEEIAMLEAMGGETGEGGGRSARDPAALIAHLFGAFKRKMTRRRPLMRLTWRLSDGLCLAVKGYLLIKEASKDVAPKALLNTVTNQPLQVSTTHVDTRDGTLVEPEELRRRKEFVLKTGNRERMPKTLVDASDVAALTALADPGLTLLGFKPLACIKTHHQLAHAPTFLRPDERAREGSTRTFVALWRAMLAQRRMVLCCLKRGRSAPALVALLPQAEELDAYGAQIEAPGLHMVWLPYMDDVRHPEAAASPAVAAGEALPRPSGGQVDAAVALVRALRLDDDPGAAGPEGAVREFDIGAFVNPWLKRHYDIVEAKALSEPVPPWNPAADETTEPRAELFASPAAMEALDRFRQELPQHAATKRKGAAGGMAEVKKAKAAAAASDYTTINWASLSSSGGLAGLTIDQLKIYLRFHELKLTGKKGDLVARVSEHLAGAGGG